MGKKGGRKMGSTRHTYRVFVAEVSRIFTARGGESGLGRESPKTSKKWGGYEESTQDFGKKRGKTAKADRGS